MVYIICDLEEQHHSFCDYLRIYKINEEACYVILFRKWEEKVVKNQK